MLTANSLSKWEQQSVALAAVSQCALLVRDLAYQGKVPQEQMAACINPLIQLQAPSIDDVYPELGALNCGFQTLQEMFSNDRVQSHGETVRYTLGMLLLRNKLMADSSMQDTLRRRLQYLDPLPNSLPESLPEDSGNTQNDDAENRLFSHQERILEQLANLYQDTISTLSYRIQVQGKIDNLKNERIANSIRALLLAGIRSAVLWYQLGGRRWRLVVYRKRIKETANSLRRSLIAPV